MTFLFLHNLQRHQDHLNLNLKRKLRFKSGSDGGRSSQSSPESEDFIEMAGSITSKSLGSKLQLDNQNGPLQHKRIIYGVIEVINSHVQRFVHG